MFLWSALVLTSVVFLVSCLLVFSLYKFAVWFEVKTESLFPAYITPSVNVPKAKPLSMKDYVLKEFAKANIDVKVAEAVINCESRFNPDAININTNKTYDAGLFQINSIHKDITLKDKLDYKAATAWAIKKIKRDGGFQAWSCNKLIVRN